MMPPLRPQPTTMTEPRGMTEPEPSQEHLQHARYVAEHMRRDRPFLERHGDKAPVAARKLAELDAMEREGHLPLQPLDPGIYKLPGVAKKTLAPADLLELEDILGVVQERHAEFVGTRADVAMCALAGDEDVADVRLRLRGWAERYTASRLTRPNPRDTSPVAKFDRLRGELVGFFEWLIRPSSVHTAYLRDVPFHIGWLFFRGTWADRVEFREAGGLDYEVFLRVDRVLEEYCRYEVASYSWDSTGDLQRVMAVVRRNGAGAHVVDPLLDLQALADDIAEMRPALLRGFRATSAAIQPAPGLFLDWEWGGDQVLGHVWAYATERQMLEASSGRSTRGMSAALCVGYDGLLANDWAHWIDARSLPEPDALAINVAVLEALRDRLLTQWMKIDHDALASRARAAARTSGEVDPSQMAESVAAVCQALVQRDVQIAEDHGPAEAEPRPVRRRLRSLRLQPLLDALRRLGCEVRDGKGSEVTAFRAGGRKAVIGRHTRNREVHSSHVARLLTRLGISLEEWWSLLE